MLEKLSVVGKGHCSYAWRVWTKIMLFFSSCWWQKTVQCFTQLHL